jgi:hypothetical protein
MHILYWRYVSKSPWNEERECYEAEQTVAEVELWNPLTQEVAFSCWHYSLPLAEQAARRYYPGIEYRRINGISPNRTQSWSGVEV